ncbi:MAG TPA: TonB-dependent receptor, partial [Acidobacteriota bacterium]|nr:TonB-dependent receptor [Acidobacteriota bacterium]
MTEPGARGCDLTVLVPAYNEAENMKPLLEKLVADLAPLGRTYEIIVVDDGSTDGTLEALRGLRGSIPGLRALSFRRNFGKSAALSLGFREARGRYVVTMDADLQDDSKEIGPLLAKIEEGYDLVSGWKQKRKDPIMKTVPSKLFNAVTASMTGVTLHDMNCGLKAYRADVVKTVKLRGELHRFIPVLAHWNGFRVSELRTVHHPRLHGTTKFGPARFINGFLDLLAVMCMTTQSTRPLHLFGRLGIAVAFLISSKNSAFFRWSRYWNPDSMYYDFLGSGRNKTLWVIGSFQITDTHSITPAWLNEFRLGSTYNQNTQRVGLQAKPILDLLGVQGVPDILYSGSITGVPSISITGISGISQFSHGTSNTRLWDIYDTVSVMKGRHSVKFGVNLRKDINDSEFWDKPGTFSFTGVFSGAGIADFMLGLPYSAVRAYPRAALGSTRTHSWYSGWFVQDDFKVTPRLTLNFGLRWDTTFPGEETHGLYYNFDPGTGNLVVPSSEAIGRVIPTFPSNVTLVTVSQAGFPSRLRKTDWNNFAPRVGVAWRPFGERLVIRSAYGIYFDPLSLGYIQTGGPWGGSETFINQVTGGTPLWQFPSAFPAGAP